MHRKHKQKRKAAAVVELAICLPVVILIVLSSIEGASMIFLRQTLVQASYETVKSSVKRRGTEAGGIERGNAVLATRSIEGAAYLFEYDVSESADPGIDPAGMTPDTAPRGTEIKVTLSAPANQNSVLPFGPYRDATMRVSATMIKE